LAVEFKINEMTKNKIFVSLYRTLFYTVVITFTLSNSSKETRSEVIVDNISAPENSEFTLNDLFYIYLNKKTNKLTLIDKESKSEKNFAITESDLISIYNSNFRTYDSFYSANHTLENLKSFFEPQNIVKITKVIPNKRSMYLNLKGKNLIVKSIEDTIIHDFTIVLELDEKLHINQYVIDERSIPEGYWIDELLEVSENKLEFYIMGNASLLNLKNQELYYRATFKFDSFKKLYVFDEFVNVTLPEYFIGKRLYYNMSNRTYKDSLFTFMISKDIYHYSKKLDFNDLLDDVFAVYDVSKHQNHIYLIGMVDENIAKVKSTKTTNGVNYTISSIDLDYDIKSYKTTPLLFENKLYQHPKNCNCILITTLD